MPPPPRQARWDLPADPSIAAKCRGLVRDTLGEWGLRDLVDDVSLVVGELLANAVMHGAGPVHVVLSAYPGRLVGAVTDHGPRLPRARHAERDDECGRGLEIVERLTDRWGVRPLSGGGGKCVWFVCGIPSGTLSDDHLS